MGVVAFILKIASQILPGHRPGVYSGCCFRRDHLPCACDNKDTIRLASAMFRLLWGSYTATKTRHCNEPQPLDYVQLLTPQIMAEAINPVKAEKRPYLRCTFPLHEKASLINRFRLLPKRNLGEGLETPHAGRVRIFYRGSPRGSRRRAAFRGRAGCACHRRTRLRCTCRRSGRRRRG